MNDRQRVRHQQQPDSGGPDTGSAGAGNLPALRASANRILDVADNAFEQIRSEDSREHVFRHRQRGGQ